MNTRIQRILMLGCATIIMACVAPLATANNTPGSYHYTYFNECLPLALDTARVAVQDVPVDQDLTLPERLTAHGLDGDHQEPVAIVDWTVAPLAGAARAAGDVEQLVASLANSDDFAFVSPVFTSRRGQPVLITRDLLVGFEDGVPPAVAERLLADVTGGVVLDRDFAGLAGVYRVRSASRNGFEVLDQANALATQPLVRYAEPDMIVRASLSYTPDDPLYSQQWALNQASDQDLDAPEAWDITTGDPSIEVVILDCGIQQNHPDLNQLSGQDFTQHGTSGGGPYNDCDHHATCVAGCVSAAIDNGIGVVGIAPDCKVKSAKIGTVVKLLFFCTPFMDSQPSYVANGINWAVTSGARVTNSSFGYEESATVTTAYNNAYSAGVVNVAATGNDGASTISYPASLSTVLGAGALNSSGAKASFGSYGTGIAFSAPGEAILTTDRTGSDGYESGDTATVDGTSFASPYSAGVAALVLSMDPALTPDAVAQYMYDGCVDLGTSGYDTTYGWGFVNAYNSIEPLAGVYWCAGDMNCDLVVSYDDIDLFVEALSHPGGVGWPYACRWDNGDCNGDNDVTYADIDPFVGRIGATCY